ncbi:O-acetylhomoserine aminocarboxypropyltransferase/cysteine synthase [Haloarcula sp. CBA1130]|uniref:O-acetylhomoserine aminocarboxypropyltransferase/cysteine synthase family protein n=1 Tax=unclassified Haloarcula TaxID=2624677 RepID=UPI0012471592|nr:MULTISPECIES: O-acetylhomoserine aminocarboxypropyltransferase/cysteine synthase family protein [unclassified Haloarcula]KAA9399145.1 O-acetylhomoserine aminocarboxypropyltransferase/cysteine synthase [Haloarcula sp. CBA1129]KAA9403658.1 O-acetylhomoserine aminocarboxypropyltransferase/cysteine synthase [Haloarcula sp. CBA1130]
MTNDYGFGTRCVHAGQEEPDPVTGARAPPIYQTSSYVFEDADTAADRYALEDDGNVYSRFDNPTVRMLENRIASLENAADAVATGSGMAALDAGTFVLAANGDNIVTASSIYGGTHSYFSKAANRRGIETRFVDTLDPDAYAAAIDEDTAYVHFETIGNPSLVVPPMEEIAEVAHDHGVPVFVDNTFGTPALCNPLDHGVDLLWESTTKWIHGSGTTVGGVLVDGGSFPWAEYPEKFPELGGENEAFGKNFSEAFGDRAFSVAARQRALRSLGDGQKPFDAWATLQGAETLSLRMERHCENAMTVAQHLDDHPEVAWVTYPGLESHETHDLAQQYLSGGFGGIVTFGLEGGFDAGRQFCEETELAQFLANIGDAKTLVIHPASTTHAQLSEAEQRASGVTPDLIRFSVGIEDAEDIITDIDDTIERVT